MVTYTGIAVVYFFFISFSLYFILFFLFFIFYFIFSFLFFSFVCSWEGSSCYSARIRGCLYKYILCFSLFIRIIGSLVVSGLCEKEKCFIYGGVFLSVIVILLLGARIRCLLFFKKKQLFGLCFSFPTFVCCGSYIQSSVLLFTRVLCCVQPE